MLLAQSRKRGCNSRVLHAGAVHRFWPRNRVLIGDFVVNLTDVFLVVGNLDIELPSESADCAASDGAAFTQSGGRVVSAAITSGVPERNVPEPPVENDDTAENEVPVLPENGRDQGARSLPDPRLVEEVLVSDGQIYDPFSRLTGANDDRTLLELAGLIDENLL